MDNQDVNVEFSTLDESTFNALMGDAPPATTPTADTLPGNTKPEKTEDKPEPKVKPAKAEKVEVVEPKAQEDKTQEEIDKDIDSVLGDETTTTTETQSGEPDVAEFFKAKAQGLIERGIWQEFEGMEDFEWTEENYGRLVEEQATWKAEDMYEERVAKVGNVGKAILEFTENGGNPAEIIDLFKASERVSEFDITTDAGREETITEYYTKVVGWTPAKAKRYVKSLIDSGDDSFATEAREAKDEMEAGIQEQIKAAQAQQKAVQEVQKKQAEAWESNMTKSIRERGDLTEKEKKDIHSALLVYNQKLPDGRTVNNFMVEFMKMQSDPNQYIDLVRYVTNKERFLEKVEKKVETEVAKKNWNLIKGNGSLSKATGTSHNKTQDKTSKSDLVLDWKKLVQ